MNKRLIAASIIVGALVISPFATSALTIEDLQAQIRELLSKVSALQAELTLKSSTETRSETISVTAVPRLCKVFSDKALAIGMRNDDVRGLQEFLQSEGVLKAEATGYFGTATRDALRAWQVNNGVVAARVSAGAGTVGPRTREALMRRCGQSGPISVSPERGSAPLTVVVTAKIGDQGPTRPSWVDGQDTLIDFGDGSERQWVQCETVKNDQFGGQFSGGECRIPQTFKHTYSENGSYTIQLVQAGGMCMGGCAERVVGTAYVTVADAPIACTKEYQPVCGQRQVQCVTAPCDPVQQTYGNQCTMRADGATFVHSGVCRDKNPNPESDPRCKAWYDGCNSCSRGAPGEPAMCTLRACTAESMQPAYCTAYFDGSTNRAPTISSFSGPVSLGVNETGTWNITASDPENQQLTYSVTWGDEWVARDSNAALSPPSQSIMQQTTFTHSFSTAGSYTVKISVRDPSGLESRSSATVQVGTGVCGDNYAPVCGRPSGCANTCAPGMYCTAVCRLHDPVMYTNSCYLRNADATYLHEGQCTANSNTMY